MSSPYDHPCTKSDSKEQSRLNAPSGGKHYRHIFDMKHTPKKPPGVAEDPH